MKKTLKKILPKPLFFLLKKGRALTEDLPVFIIFLFKPTKIKTTFFDRFYLIFKCYQISFFIECAHMENEMIQVMSEIFSLDQTREYVIAEAGSFKGGSGAKLSLAVRMANKKDVLRKFCKIIKTAIRIKVSFRVINDTGMCHE